MHSNTKYKVNELAIQAAPFPFDINTGNDPYWPIPATSLYHLSGMDDELALDEWIEPLFDELGIPPEDYIHEHDVSADETEYLLTSSAGTKILASMNGEVGNAARKHLEQVTAPEDEDQQLLDATRKMLWELGMLYRELNQALADSRRWDDTRRRHEVGLNQVIQSDRNTDRALDQAFRKGVAELAFDRMLKFGAANHKKTLEIIDEIDRIYESDLYSEAEALGLAPKCNDQPNK